jgi:hypothetical protein
MAREHYEWEDSPDLTSMSEAELRERIEGLVREEREVSYRRRVLQGRIDLMRRELVRRGDLTLSTEDLVRVLMEEGARGAPGGPVGGPGDGGGSP